MLTIATVNDVLAEWMNCSGRRAFVAHVFADGNVIEVTVKLPSQHRQVSKRILRQSSELTDVDGFSRRLVDVVRDLILDLSPNLEDSPVTNGTYR